MNNYHAKSFGDKKTNKQPAHDSNPPLMILFYLGVYLFGGITFLPLVVYIFFSLSKPIEDPPASEPSSLLKAGEIEEEWDTGIATYKRGWVIVTRDFYQVQKDTKEKEAEEFSAASKIASDPEDAKKLKGIKKKHRYFGVLKHRNLFLYKDESAKSVQRVVNLSSYVVTIWPQGLPDAGLFTKRTAICITKSETSLVTEPLVVPKNSFFLQTDLNHEKEEWYFALIRAIKSETSNGVSTNLKGESDSLPKSLDPCVSAKTRHFITGDSMSLIQTINSTEGQLTTKWLNALVGRLFLAVYQTDKFHAAIKEKIDAKLLKINRPGFLDEFETRNLTIGHTAPFLTYPRLKTLSPEGELCVECMFEYHDGISLEITTCANINISHFKPKEVNVNLRVKLAKLKGKIVLCMKPPPSNRVWYCFQQMPELDLNVEPTVSSRSLNYNLINTMISNKFREAVRESLVWPAMDDFVFFNTEGSFFRGGIWETDSAVEPDLDSKDESIKDEALSVSTSTELEPPPEISRSTTDISSKSSNTNLTKRIGQWYQSRKKPVIDTKQEASYTRPEMISQRRSSRKSDDGKVAPLFYPQSPGSSFEPALVESPLLPSHKRSVSQDSTRVPPELPPRDDPSKKAPERKKPPSDDIVEESS